MFSPWAKIPKPEPVKLDEIMSEQVAALTEEKKEKRLSNSTSNKNWKGGLKAPTEKPESSNQANVQVVEKNSELVDNYDESDNDEIVNPQEEKEWDRYDDIEKNHALMPTYKKKINTTSKVVNKTPATKVVNEENFQLDHINLPSHVKNSLKIYSQIEETKKHKKRHTKTNTSDFGFDEDTTLILDKMITNDVLDSLNRVVHVGQKSRMLHANGSPTCKELNIPDECLVKIFSTKFSEYEQQDNFVMGNYLSRTYDRFEGQITRRTVDIWAEKEVVNLCRLKRAGIPCPEVLMLKDNVLVMSFIGDNQRPAESLKDAVMEPSDYIKAYEQVVSMMNDVYNKANLIHGHLGEDTILWYKGQCYFIDWCQAGNYFQQKSYHLLYKECKRITEFFKSKEVPNVASPDELYASINIGRSYETMKQNFKNRKSKSDTRCTTMARFQAETVEKFQNLSLKLLDGIEVNERKYV